MSGQLFNLLDSVREQAKDALWALSSCLCQQSASVKINGRSCSCSLPHQAFMSVVIDKCIPLIDKIIKVLGEGGFSFVYLAQDETSGVSS